MKYTFAKAEKSTVKINIDLSEKEWNEWPGNCFSANFSCFFRDKC